MEAWSGATLLPREVRLIQFLDSPNRKQSNRLRTIAATSIGFGILGPVISLMSLPSSSYQDSSESLFTTSQEELESLSKLHTMLS